MPLHLRLALALLSFAVFGAAVSYLTQRHAGVAASSYAVAIGAGDDLAVSRAGEAAPSHARHGRGLTCRDLVRVGPVGIGTACARPASTRVASGS